MSLSFLSGMPGVDLEPLLSMLSQHPSISLRRSSGAAEKIISCLPGCPVNDLVLSKQILSSVMNSDYSHNSENHILDCSNHWIDLIRPLEVMYDGDYKIVCVVDGVDLCAANLVETLKPVDKDMFLSRSSQIAGLKNFYVSALSLHSLGLKNIIFVDQSSFLDDPVAESNRVLDFLGLDCANYDPSALPKTARPDTEKVLDRHRITFTQTRFWRGETRSDLPVHDLDLQLAAGLRGDFDLGWQIAKKIEEEEPWNDRAAFNRGWYLLRQGHLLEGENLLQRGRNENVFGNAPPSAMPIWDGVTPCTVLLNLEGGLGDQIHGVRYAQYIANRGCKVLVAANNELVPLFDKTPGVTALLRHEVAAGVFHDAWVPSMSAVPILGLEYKDINGQAYINKPVVPKGNKFRIGLRWQGNPRFEHEQHRLFPHHLLFDAVKDLDVEYVSLQRDQGAEHRPYWAKKVPLDNWKQTQDAVAGCDLVISSCTSMAHFSAAMGIETWIIVPVLSYYLWALPGDTTPWYDSVRLYRQEQPESWGEPFVRVKEDLVRLLKEKS